MNEFIFADFENGFYEKLTQTIRVEFEKELPIFYKKLDGTPSFKNISSSYKILGLPTSASLEEVKNAYRKLAKIYHPDNVPQVAD